MDRVIAFILGMICFVCTLVILFSHVRSLGDLTVIHLYIIVSFAISVGAGFYMWHAGVINAIAFFFIFVVSTAVCVGLSGSRSYSSLEKQINDAATRDAERAAIIADITQADSKLAAAQKALDDYTQKTTRTADAAADQCLTGKGNACTGHTQAATLRSEREKQLTTARDGARDYLTQLQHKLDAHPAIEALAEIRPLARVYAMATGTTEAHALSIVIVVLAYSLAILTEFSGVTFLNYALHPPRRHDDVSAATAPVKLPTLMPSRAPITTPPTTVALSDIARELKLDPRIARKKVRELGIEKPLQGWSFPPDVADDIKTRLSSSP